MRFLTHTEIYNANIINNAYVDFINKSKSERKDMI